MRFPLLMLAFGLILTSCDVNIQMADAPFTLDSLMTYDYNGLEKLFGAEKLKDSLAIDSDYKPIRYTLVMPGTKAAVLLQWVDTSRVSIDYATISGTASAWKTRDSVTLGMSIIELERINDAPFYFYNDKKDPESVPDWASPDDLSKPGYVMIWNTEEDSKPKLAGHIYSLRLNALVKASEHLSDIIASNRPEAIENNPIVIEVSLSRMNIPLDIQIEEVVFTRTANIPHAISNRPDDRVDKINDVILKYFDLKSFDSEKAEDFSWSNLNLETEMDDNTIAIHIRGTYVSSYPSDIDDVLFIDKSGYKMDRVSIPFHTLFAYDGYFNFLNEYWSEKCYAAMSEAVQCANQTPLCTCYDIAVSSSDTNIVISTSGDCYPHAAEACNPKATAQVSLKDLTPYLSDFGKMVVLESNYFSESALQQFNIANEYRYKLPNVMFIRFDIVNAIDDSQADQAVLGLLLTPNDDPFSGKVEGWFKYLNIDGESVRFTGEFAEDGSFVLKNPDFDELSFVFASKSGDRYDPSQGYELQGNSDGTRFEIIKVLYNGFPFYEPRGD